MADPAPGRESLVYHRSKVSWATAEFLDRPPAAATRGFLYAVVSLFVVAWIYTTYAKVAISIETRGQLTTRDAILPINAPVSFRIAKVHVANNQRVEAGQLLVESDTRLSDVEYERIRSQKEVLAGLLAKKKAGNCTECLRGLRAFSQDAFQIENKGTIRDTLAAVRQRLLDYISQEEISQNFETANASSRRRIQVAESKLAEIRKRNAEKMLAMQVEELTNEIVSARAYLSERRQAVQTGVSHAQNQLELTLGELMERVDAYRSQNVLVAPSAGIVSQLRSGEGQLVLAGQMLMEIVPLESGLIAELFVTNRDISKIEPGMEVRIKLDALPDREYGLVKGRIDAIPPTLTQAAGGAAYYATIVKLDVQSLEKDGIEYPFRPGMSLSGVVVTRYESLFKVGLRKVFNIKDDLLKD